MIRQKYAIMIRHGVARVRRRGGIAITRRGYTLIELLITITLTMMMMYAVTNLFATMSQGVANARSTLEMTEALRGAATRVRMDLEGATAVTSAPERPDAARGYLEARESPIGPMISPFLAAVNGDTGESDTTVGDPDDVLMLTTRSRTQPFVGRCVSSPGGVLQSDVAEVAYFVRGRTLYRRVLLVAPSALPTASPPNAAGFYAGNDVSVRMELVGGVPKVFANTLADLARRECRFAHPLDAPPIDARRWLQLGLPTLYDCGAYYIDTSNVKKYFWNAGAMAPVLQWPSSVPSNEVQVGEPSPGTPPFPPGMNYWKYPPDPIDYCPIDYWNNPHPWQVHNPTTKQLEPLTDPGSGLLTWPDPNDSSNSRRLFPSDRGSEDVLLNNVVSFDVKVWDPLAPILLDTTVASPRPVQPGDPGYLTALTKLASQPPGATILALGAYVDLGYAGLGGNGMSAFSGPGVGLLSVQSVNATGFVYDTWSTSYIGSRGTNGLDDNLNQAGQVQPDGVVDDPGEWELPPPYAAKLRGIQIKIRVFEPGSRQVRELTLVQEFVAK